MNLTAEKKEERRLAACARAKAWRLDNPDRYRETKRKYSAATKAKTAKRSAKWARENKERVKKNASDWYARNREIVLARSLEWAAKNSARVEKNQRAYRIKNSEKRVFDAQTRRATQAGSQPTWANEFFIREIYDLCRRRNRLNTCGVRWQVDHVVPIQSKKVCGLHVERNLRVVPAQINNKKGNRHWPDMP